MSVLKRVVLPAATCLIVALVSFPAVLHAVSPGQQRVRVGGDIQAPKKIRDVRPVYPEDAKAAGVQGIVIIEAVIGTDGVVKEAKVIRGVPLLDKAALEAVMQWRYTPTLLNGEPVELVMTVTVTFTLSAGREAELRTPGAPVRVGGQIKAPKKIHDVPPTFPEGQQEAAKQGVVVILEIAIGTGGQVTNAKVLRPAITIETTIDKQGNVTDAKLAPQNAFAQAALEAVKQWRYEPTLLNGVAVPVVMTVTVTFKVT